MLAGWGRTGAVRAVEVRARDLAAGTEGAVLSRGLGRSYGDASLPPHGAPPVASTLAADRVLHLDEDSALLHAEAGATLERLAAFLLPRGLFLPVVPGTAFVTLGGMVAADVHGKNHHVAGTIGRHVRSLTMRLADGRIVEADRERNGELLRATLGGMGLTGHILDATVALERVPSRHVVEESRACPDLESLADALEDASARFPFTVAWSDFVATRGRFGRGIVLAGRWATAREAAGAPAAPRARIAVPFVPPVSPLGDGSIGAYNTLRYEMARRLGPGGHSRRVVAAEPFFWPLDAIGHWNRLYGPRGFTQVQCVLPRDATGRRLRRVAEAARSGGPGPFLVVLKDCGEEGEGLLSFPFPGLSLAMDFPAHEGIVARLDGLHRVIQEEGGRLYLAKDAFATRERFEAMEQPRAARFAEARRRFDPDGRLRSAQSERLMGW